MSAIHQLNPDSVAKPAGAYSQAILCSRPGDWLYVSGQIGVEPDGTMPTGIEAEAENIWRNLVEVLRSGGMNVNHLVKLTTYSTDVASLAAIGAVRAEYLQEHRPASTVLVVQALAKPQWRLEVEAVAFRESAP